MGPGGQNRRHSSPLEGLVSQVGRMIIIVIKGQVLTPMYHKNKFIILFHLIELVFLPFCMQKRGSRIPTLLFVKIIGPEV